LTTSMLAITAYVAVFVALEIGWLALVAYLSYRLAKISLVNWALRKLARWRKPTPALAV
jgi:hypothetical protein